VKPENAPQAILLIEDSDEDYQTLMWVFKKIGAPYLVYRVSDADEALDFLTRRGSFAAHPESLRPSLILLDLNLPGTDGREFLKEIKDNLDLKTIPLIVLTTTANPKDVETCYRNGANSYILKPVNLDKFSKSLQLLLDYWFEVTTLPTSPETK
jgi:CheY-like chemotaxis protein